MNFEGVTVGEPLTLAALGGAALSQGVAFVYSQAGELLKRRRERREPGIAGEPRQVDAAVLEGRPAPLVEDHSVLERIAAEMAELRRRLSDYVDEIREITPADRELLDIVDALRCLLESVYGQRFTFHGESREPSGPVVEGTIDVDAVLGKAAAVRVGTVSGSAKIRGEAKANRVEGELRGVDIDRIDGQ